MAANANNPIRPQPYRSITSQEALDKLRAMPQFQALTQDEFDQVAQLIRAESFQRGKPIFQQGDFNTTLYVVRKGVVMEHRAPHGGAEEFTGMRQPGEILNALAFFTGARAGETSEADTDLTLWAISRKDFDVLAKASPAIAQKVSTSLPPDHQTVLKNKARFAWQRPDEVILYSGRKHIWFFLRTFWLPTLMLIAGGVFALFFRELFAAILPIVLIVAIIPAAWIGWHFVDWLNDYYVVTDRRIVRRERIMFLRDDLNHLPVSQVQNIAVNRNSYFSILFDMGNVEVEAMGNRSRLHFDLAAQPDRIKNIIFQAREMSRAEVYASDRARIRMEIRKEIGLAGEPPMAAPAAASTRGKVLFARGPAKPRAPLDAVGRALATTRETLIPRVRLQQGDNIIYRQHWLELVKRIGLPILILMVAGVFTAVPLSQGVTVIGLPSAVIFLGVLFWLIWRYEDWRNDIYILTADRIIDIKRSPFGITGARRKEAAYSVVQNVDARIIGFVNTLFDVGSVYIRTAGQDNELEFKHVFDPRGVQRDVEERLNTFRMRDKEKDFQRRRAEMSEWLGIYDELRQTHP